MNITGKNRLRHWLLLGVMAWGIQSASAVQLVSLSGSTANKLGGSGDSELAIISRDGRYVLFASTANNLTLTNNNNSVIPCRFNVYLRDRVNQTTTLVSASQSGTGGGNGDSFPTGLSTNGQFALFESSASDLAPNDTNGVSNVFVRDVINGTTTLVSVGTNGGVASGVSRGSVITPDGRYVAFTSLATNLVAGDTNGIADVFVRDLALGQTTLVSVGAATNTIPPTPYIAATSESPEITPDGRYVVFYSTATNLVAGVNTTGEIYVRDRVAGQTIWASTNARAIFESVTGSSNMVSCNYTISDDGQYVAYEACTNNWQGAGALGVVLRYSLVTGLTDIINTNANVPLYSYELVHNVSMTPNGRFVTYVGSLNAYTNPVYCWDAQSGLSTLVSVSLDNVTPANGFCDSPVISTNGQFVGFVSTGTNLVTNSLNGFSHVYVRDLQAGVTQLLDTDTNGTGQGVEATVTPAMSADGSVVVFDSANLLPDNRHLMRDVFARVLAAGTNSVVSAANPGLISLAPNGSSGLTAWSVSSNGQYLAFYSDADNVAANDTGGCRNVFVANLQAGTNVLVSVNTNGNGGGDGPSFDPAISGDGRYVAFTSLADNLTTSGDAYHVANVYVRDLQAQTTTLLSYAGNGAGNGDSFSPVISANGRYVLFHSKATNLAGQTGSASGYENLYFYDLQLGTNHPLTVNTAATGVYASAMTPDGQFVAFIGTRTGTSTSELYAWNSQSNSLIFTNSISIPDAGALQVAISPDGHKLAYLLAGSPVNLNGFNLVSNTVVTMNSGIFLSTCGLRFDNSGRFLTYAVATNLTTNIQRVYRYDFQGGSNLLVSQIYSGSVATNTVSDSPCISPDGRFIAYRSSLTNLVAFDFNNAPDVFVYDVSNNATYLISVNAAGTASAADRSLKPFFSPDGQTLLFQSWASDISGGDYNVADDIFALNVSGLPMVTGSGIGSTNAASGFEAQLIPAGAGGFAPTLRWPLAAGKTYQVQYKTNLTDAVWWPLPGNITFIGDTGYLTDQAPPPTQRFYRIVLNP